jgi:integrase
MAAIFKRSKRKNEPYVIQYRDHEGKRRTVQGFTERGLTEQLAGKLESEARQRRMGLIDTEQERLAEHRNSDLASLLDLFQASLASNTPKHVDLTMFRIRRIVTGCQFERLADISRESVATYLRQFVHDQGIGHRTFNHYAQAIDSFCNWCVETNRLGRNPLKGIERRNAEVDVRHPRRALTPEEVTRLVAVTRSSGKKVQNLSPELRARAYFFSYLTGLRKAELASLTPVSFQLDHEPPTVTLAAAFSKHRRKDVLPLHPELVTLLRYWLKGMKPGDPLFPLLARKKLSEMIQKDLKRAGIPYRTAEGIADFHAAGRHTYITQLLRTGASLPEAKELARHTDVKMTMRYTHIGIDDQARAVANLPMPQQSNAKLAEKAKNIDRALQMRCISDDVGSHSPTSPGTRRDRKQSPNANDGKNLDTERRRLSPIVKAEGTGVEPATGFPAPDFESYIQHPVANGK